MSAVTKIKKSGTTYDINDSRISTSGSTNGQVLTANGSGGMSFAAPSVGSSNISSGSATSGQVLTADGSGGAAWQNASGGGGLHIHKVGITASHIGATYFRGSFLIAHESDTALSSADMLEYIKSLDNGQSYQKTVPISAVLCYASDNVNYENYPQSDMTIYINFNTAAAVTHNKEFTCSGKVITYTDGVPTTTVKSQGMKLTPGSTDTLSLTDVVIA